MRQMEDREEAHAYFSATFIEHMRNPKGLVLRPDFPVSGQASATGRVAGSRTTLWIAVAPDARIARLGWYATAMPHVVAGMSALSEWVLGPNLEGPGKPLEDVFALLPTTLAERLGGLPGRLIHESIIGPALLRDAVTDYFLSLGLSGRTDQPTPPRKATRPAPCPCIARLEQAVLDALHAGSSRWETIEESGTVDCPTCRAFGPALLAWSRWRRRRREGER